MTEERRIRCFGCHSRFMESEMLFWEALGYWLCNECVHKLRTERSQLLQEVIDQLVERFGAREVLQTIVDNEAAKKLLTKTDEYIAFEEKWCDKTATWTQTWVLSAARAGLYGQNHRSRPIG